MSKFEEIKRAIAEPLGYGWLFEERAYSMSHPEALEAARKRLDDATRAAIEAMREPTDAMLSAGLILPLLDSGFGRPTVETVWETIIDEILK